MNGLEIAATVVVGLFLWLTAAVVIWRVGWPRHSLHCRSGGEPCKRCNPKLSPFYVDINHHEMLFCHDCYTGEWLMLIIATLPGFVIVYPLVKAMTWLGGHTIRLLVRGPVRLSDVITNVSTHGGLTEKAKQERLKTLQAEIKTLEADIEKPIESMVGAVE